MFIISGDVPPKWLLPNALLSPGWHHMCDGLVRHGLCSVAWFPRFLAQLKCLSRFVRDYREDLKSVLISQGLSGLASAIQATQAPTFTDWRWGKLLLVTSAVAGILDSMKMHSDKIEPLLRKSRDRKWQKNVKDALGSQTFVHEFRFVHWYAEWLSRLEKWCGSCPCEEHRELRRQGVDVPCELKGRVLPLARREVRSSIDSALSQLEDWRIQDFGHSQQLQTSCQGIVRAVCGRAMLEFHYLQKLPYLLANLDDREVLRIC